MSRTHFLVKGNRITPCGLFLWKSKTATRSIKNTEKVPEVTCKNCRRALGLPKNDIITELSITDNDSPGFVMSPGVLMNIYIVAAEVASMDELGEIKITFYKKKSQS